MTDENSFYRKEQEKIILINTWFKIFLISSITGTILYKIVVSTFDLSAFNFSDLLSLLLAIFSIGLSVMFYVKADETSNRFYDNTHKFTQEVSIILGRIEAGFGERLKHIDEGYGKIEGYFYSKPGESNKQQIQKNREEVKKVEEEKDMIIQDLLEKTKLQDKEKQTFIEKLRKKDMELEKTRHDLFRLQEFNEKKLTLSEYQGIQSRVLKYFNEVIIGREIFKNTKSTSDFILKFNENLNSFNPQWIRDLIRLGWCSINGQINKKGAERLFRELESFMEEIPF